MNLTLRPDQITWPETHYLFVEKVGPFMQTAPKAWQELKKLTTALSGSNMQTFMALYKVHPQMVYRAGVALKEKPSFIPDGLQYTVFPGGEYLRYVLQGSYSQLPEACGKVFSEVEKNKIKLRDDFFIEHYVNDPAKTSEADLHTEILIPV